MWMIIISARLLDAVTQPKLRSAPLVIEPAASFPPAEASCPLKADTLTASILRTHSQCQRGSSRPVITASLRRTVVFIPGKILVVGGGAYRDRTDDLMLAKQPLSQLS